MNVSASAAREPAAKETMGRAMKSWFEQYKLHINVVALSALASMVSVYPFDSSFRFTLGCVVLAVMLLYFRQLPVAATIAATGAAIFTLRSGVNVLFGYRPWDAVLLDNFPAFLYYLVLAALWCFFNVRGSIGNMALVILKLSVADIVSNVVEISLRSDIDSSEYERFLIGIVAVGVIRAILSFYGYYSLKKYQNFVLAGEQLERYTELTLIIAKLRAELFYLKKSSQDIEQVMQESYWLYNELSTGQDRSAEEEKSLGGRALMVARSIHEIKKDYYRVSTGIEKALNPSAVERGMALSEIMFIIEQNTLRFLAGTNKAISLRFIAEGNLSTNRHYDIVSILDNLIMNAIEACGESGNIGVLYEVTGGQVVFAVSDDGCGISQSDHDVLFEPGYSTKFSPHTGKMSTGLGLAHVKDLVTQLGGDIQVASEPGRTCFTVRLPLDQLTL